jgi:tetratricopeptide (TPR) repeat protein
MRYILLIALAALVSNLPAQQPAPDADSIFRQAVTLHRSGDINGAIRKYREYLQLKPDSIEARSNLGAALARTGHYDEAITEYETALQSSPKNAPVLLNLALAYYKTGRVQEAAPKLEQAAALAGAPNEQITLLLASCYNRLGEFKKTIALLAPLEKQKSGEPVFDYLYGMALIRDGDVQRGGAVMDRILRRGDSAEAHLLLGMTKLRASDFDGALADYKKAIELNPKLPEAHARLGELLLTMGDSPAAEQAFRDELAIDPTSFPANLNLGVIAKQKQDYSVARRYFERALRVRPGDPGVRFQIATLDIATGKLEPARAQLEALVKEAPDFTEAHVSLSQVYFRLERVEDAERERAIAQDLLARQQPAGKGAPRR